MYGLYNTKESQPRPNICEKVLLYAGVAIVALTVINVVLALLYTIGAVSAMIPVLNITVAAKVFVGAIFVMTVIGIMVQENL